MGLGSGPGKTQGSDSSSRERLYLVRHCPYIQTLRRSLWKQKCGCKCLLEPLVTGLLTKQRISNTYQRAPRLDYPSVRRRRGGSIGGSSRFRTRCPALSAQRLWKNVQTGGGTRYGGKIDFLRSAAFMPLHRTICENGSLQTDIPFSDWSEAA